MDKLITQDKFVSFSSRVTTFINGLHLNNTTLEEKLTKEIVKYFLRISTSRRKAAFALKSMFSRLGLRSEIDAFQGEYLHISYYLLRVLYPAVINAVKSDTFPKALADDIAFCLSNLTKVDLEVLKSNANIFDSTEYSTFETCMGDECWVKDYNGLLRYVKTKLNKFHIIMKNDPSIDKEDCIQEILLSIVRIYNADPKAFQNKSYVDTAISNQINTFLSYYTRGKRKRINNSCDGKYKEIKVLKKQRAASEDKEFYTGAIDSLQKEVQQDSEYSATIVDFNDMKQAYEMLISDDSTEDRIFISELLTKVESKKMIKEYFQILLDHNEDFERWVDQRSLKTNNFTSLCRNAKKYLQAKYKKVPESWPAFINSSINLKACMM
jgi:hypothetical protein